MRTKIWSFLFVLEKNAVFSSVKKGLMLSFLIFLFGSVSRLVYALPYENVHNLLYVWHNGLIDNTLTALLTATDSRLSLYLVIAISYYYAQSKNLQNSVLLLMAITVSVINFMMIANIMGGSDYMTLLGISGIVLAISSAIISTLSFTFFTKLIMTRRHLTDLGSDDNLKMSSLSVLPMLCTLILNAIFYSFIADFLDFTSIYDNALNQIMNFFNNSNNEYFSGLIYLLLINSLWFFGIHGGNVLQTITDQVFIPNVIDSSSIISKSFITTFAHIGGCGTMFCLMLAAIVVSRRRGRSYKGMIRWSFILVPINISELVVFGFSFILNPIMLIPLILVPLVSLSIAYWATVINFMPIVNNSIGWAIPVFFSGYLTTHNITGVVVQLLILICGTLIYIPFVDLHEQFQEERESRILELLINDFQQHEKDGLEFSLLSRSDVGGQIAKAVAKRLRSDLDNHSIPIYYQPQLNQDDSVIGAEALLRWRYQDKVLYPPFVIALAQEEGIQDALTLEILNTVASSISEITNILKQDLHFSMNFGASQINNIVFVNKVIDIIQQHGVNNQIYLELTEETSISGLKQLKSNIMLLSEMGIDMAIDDFGMGQTSLNYLKENNFKYVKLDGELVKHLLEQPRCAEIITSIINLGETLEYKVIAEFVETKELKDKLLDLGCFIYQGYYYSPALPKEDFIEYCSKY